MLAFWIGGGVLVCRVAVWWQRIVGPFTYHFVASRWMSFGARCLVRRFVLCLSVLCVSCPLTRSECHSVRSSFRVCTCACCCPLSTFCEDWDG